MLPQHDPSPLLTETLKIKLRDSFGKQHLTLSAHEICADFMKQLRADPVQGIRIGSIGLVPHTIHQHVEYHRPVGAPSVDEIWARLEKEVMIFTQAEYFALKEAYNQRKAEAKQAIEEGARKAQQLAEDIRTGRVIERWYVSVKSLDGGLVEFFCDSNATVLEFKTLISLHSRQPVENIRLVYAGRPLEDQRTLQDYYIDGSHVSKIKVRYMSKQHTHHAPVSSHAIKTLEAPLDMKSVARSSTREADQVLHRALQIKPQNAAAVEKAFREVQKALDEGASIHSICTVTLTGIRTDLAPSGSIAESRTVLQSAARLMGEIELEVKDEAEKNKAKEALLHLIRYLIDTPGANPDDKANNARPLLNYFLPYIHPVHGTKDPVWNFTGINYLASKGVYNVDDRSLARQLEFFKDNPFAFKTLKRIKFIKALKVSVLKILQQEANRLDEKKPSEEDDFQSQDHFLCFGPKPHVDDYSQRRKVLNEAIADLNSIVTNFSKQSIQMIDEGAFERFERQVKASIDIHLIKQEKSLNKYSDYEQLGRGFLNVILVVCTGIFPGLIKYGLTGTWYVSIAGQTREAVDTARHNLEKVFQKP